MKALFSHLSAVFIACLLLFVFAVKDFFRLLFPGKARLKIGHYPGNNISTTQPPDNPKKQIHRLVHWQEGGKTTQLATSSDESILRSLAKAIEKNSIGKGCLSIETPSAWPSGKPMPCNHVCSYCQKALGLRTRWRQWRQQPARTSHGICIACWRQQCTRNNLPRPNWKIVLKVKLRWWMI